MKSVLLNADDFGMSPLFNRAILDLIKEGHLQSTSVMMSRINFAQKNDIEELQCYYSDKNISIGLHVEYFDDRFEHHLNRQLAGFFKVFGKNPDHIDLHVHTYLENGYPYIIEKALALGIPCRNYSEQTKNSSELKVCDYKFSGSRKSIDECIEYINSVDDGIIEFVFHPGYEDKWYITSMKKERQYDIEKCKVITKYCKKEGIPMINYTNF